LAASFVGNHNTPSGDFVNSLVCDSDGVMYAADSRLYTININNGSATSLGVLPCESSGDLAYNDGDLYLACVANQLLKIDRDNTNNSQIIGTMQANNPFFGIVTYATQCTDVETYGTAGNELYQINIENANSTLFCPLPGVSEVYGAAMETDFIASNCDIILDLDVNNSSGATGSDFFADTLCGNFASMVADLDFLAEAEGLIVDSMVFYISGGLLDGADEQLILESSGGMDIFGSGTNRILLINTPGISNADIVHPLENTMYINMAMPFTPGTREVSVQIFAKDNSQTIVESDIATAFIPLVSGEDFTIDLGMDTTLCAGQIVDLDASVDDAIAYEWNDGTTDAIYQATNSGTYAVTITNTCGSTATDEISIQFIPAVDLLDLGPDHPLSRRYNCLSGRNYTFGCNASGSFDVYLAGWFDGANL